MPIVQTVLALTVLSILYARMVKREVPEPVTKGQAITPIILGVVSLPPSEQAAKRLPERYGASESLVSVGSGDRKNVDYAVQRPG